MCDFARAILTACGQLPVAVAPADRVAKTGRRKIVIPPATIALYREVLAVQRAPHVRGAVSAALRARNLNAGKFYSWASYQP